MAGTCTVRDKKVRRPAEAAHPFVEKTTICVELDWTSLEGNGGGYVEGGGGWLHHTTENGNRP